MNFTESRKVTLGQVSSLSGGFAFKSELAKNDKTDEQLLPIVKIGNLIRNSNLDLSDVKYYQYNITLRDYLISRNDILVAMTGATLGKVAVSQFEGLLLNQRVARIKADETIVLQKFLQFLLFSPNFYDYCQMTSGGGAQANISSEQIKNFEIFIPPIEEQHRIVKILDLAQLLIEKRKQAISYLDDYIKAVFLDMFGDPVSNPKGWDIKSIKTISHKITDGEHLNPTFSEAGMPMIMAGHVLESGVDTKSARKVPSEIGEFFRRKCNPEKNDLLLVSRGATIGRLCRVTTSELFCLMGSVILIKPDQDIVNSAFLSELLKHPRMYSNLFNSSGSSAQQAIYLKDIKKLDCIIPPIDDQRNFEKIVLEVDSIKQKMQSQLEELENNFQAQLQRAFKQD